jgi:transposase
LGTLQKKTFGYAQADEVKRKAFLDEIKDLDPKNIVYSDESGIDNNEVPAYGWGPRGERCEDKKRGSSRIRYNITAALNVQQLFAPFIFEGYSNSAVYETYIETVLIPELKPGMVLVIDNARFHKSKRVRELIENAGCRLIFLPPYSPDFNPIEHHWHSVKNNIRKLAQTVKDFYQAAVQVLGEMCIAK